mmetsp:Transcript_6175/g.8365  ORF Transcript_6175/g.8365 Transcript_6175/m.8365 type:complete len:188 (-) Transcript_6175:266-829(-)|eukprot:CAMPEP_0196575078 /NCGR_PEP_ID=MMETSP1081-20130531/4636_1 /TAXON_ID=36882 /ORGANISM="Pyramimonas amylifera, Strain CCMP720" /LENGTH=187 /DNA_ID=CAMNT_0041893273 /DNA_START=90 /DNA_END=653 /DNA_ORIENTATION=-
MASFTQTLSQTFVSTGVKHQQQRKSLRVVAANAQDTKVEVSRRAVFAGIAALSTLGIQEKASAVACKADPFGSDYYRSTTEDLNKLMLRLVSGKSEEEGTVVEDSKKYTETWNTWNDYTLFTPCNRSTCYTEVWRRGQRVAGQIVRNDGVYAKSQAVYDSAKYGKRMGQIADVFASGGICDGADAYK